MKKIFTSLKAASVMVAFFILNTSCQKEAGSPSPEATTPEAAYSSVSAARSMSETKFGMTDANGNEAGVLEITNQNGYADVEVILAGRLARNSSSLTAYILDQNGDRYARLSGFRYMPGLTSDAATHVSTTLPVIETASGRDVTYRDLLSKRGYSVMVFDISGQRLAQGKME